MSMCLPGGPTCFLATDAVERTMQPIWFDFIKTQFTFTHHSHAHVDENTVTSGERQPESFSGQPSKTRSNAFACDAGTVLFSIRSSFLLHDHSDHCLRSPRAIQYQTRTSSHCASLQSNTCSTGRTPVRRAVLRRLANHSSSLEILVVPVRYSRIPDEIEQRTVYRSAWDYQRHWTMSSVPRRRATRRSILGSSFRVDRAIRWRSIAPGWNIDEVSAMFFSRKTSGLETKISIGWRININADWRSNWRIGTTKHDWLTTKCFKYLVKPMNTEYSSMSIMETWRYSRKSTVRTRNDLRNLVLCLFE